MYDDDDSLTWWQIAILTVLLVILATGLVKLAQWKSDRDDAIIHCLYGKLTVCVGDVSKFGVPSCIDYPLNQFHYHQYNDNLVVIRRSNSSDVVNYPNRTIVSATKSECEAK